MKVRIDRDSSVPVYQQVFEYYRRAIEKEEMIAGDKLPAERDLSAQLGVARGTIKKAYDALERDGYIQSIQGRGSMVMHQQEEPSLSRKDQAQKVIGEMLNRMEKLDFSLTEVSNFVHLMIQERERRLRDFHIAAIDCNPEALSIFEHQLLYHSKVHLQKYLLEPLLKDPQGAQKLKHYNLLLTTTTHYDEIVQRFPSVKDVLIRAAVSPSQQTIMALAGIKRSARVAIFCKSHKFSLIILSKLKDFSIPEKNVRIFLMDDEQGGTLDLQGIDTLIVPPNFDVTQRKEYLSFINPFTERGGQLVVFEHRIQRGSLIYLDERISAELDRGAPQ